MSPAEHHSGSRRLTLTSFGVRQPVPANLLFIAILVAGVIFGAGLNREFFPEIRPNRATITAVYPGASPQEIEDGLILKIEDRIAELDEVDEIESTITEGVGTVVVEFHRHVRNIDAAVTTLQQAVDAIDDLPEEAERIRVAKYEPRMQVIQIGLFGEHDEAEMKRAIREIRDDIRTLPGIGQIMVGGTRTDEISVKVRPEALLEHGLSLPQVSQRIGEWMREVPGGMVRTGTQNVRIRTLGVEQQAETIRDLVVKTDAAGGVIRLHEIAEVEHGFVDVDIRTRINGRPMVSLTVFNIGDGDAVKAAEVVRAYVAGRRGDEFHPRFADHWNAMRSALQPPDAEPRRSDRLAAWELGDSRADRPLPGELMTYTDLARFIEGRLELLMRNARWGALLVFLNLLLFLNFRVAGWVMMGLLVSIMGTLAFMAAMGITLNLLTMFGLIIVLGLLADDAIVVAENITARHEAGEPALDAAVNGTRQIAWPVLATILTTIVAFMPLALLEGQIGDMLGSLPLVVACALFVSLIEAIIILPAHVGHSINKAEKRTRRTRFGEAIKRFEQGRDHLIFKRIVPAFGQWLEWLIAHRYATVSTALAVWFVSLGMFLGGRVEFVFFEGTDSETIAVDVIMPVGASIEQTDAVVRRIEEAALAMPEVLYTTPVVGLRVDFDDFAPTAAQTHLAQVWIELNPVEERERTSEEIIAAIRRAVGEVPAARSIRYQEIYGGPGGPPVNIVVSGRDEGHLLAAVEEVKQALSEFTGVVDIADNADRGQRELHVMLYDGSATLGLTAESVATQLRGATFGFAAHTIAREREDVDVRVRLDDPTRDSLAAMERQWIHRPFAPGSAGGPNEPAPSPVGSSMVPLAEVAMLSEGTGYATIRRLNRERAVTVLADAEAPANPERVVAQLQSRFRELERDWPGIRVEARGRQLETTRSLQGVREGMLLASILIYVILAWLFSSYIQPIAVMLVIPFAIIGMIWGHWLMGFNMMILSLIGFVALTGIVVNGSLIYIQFYNTRRQEGLPMHRALVEAGMQRLRPIVLTTLTTVLGLSPLLLEQSFQARFLIPMAITISFGLISATVVVLIVLPCILMIGRDVRLAVAWLWTGGRDVG